MALADAKVRTFFAGDRAFDVEMNLPDNREAFPVTYCVDWHMSTKLVFNAPREGMHFPVLLAALDQLEESNELDLEVSTTPSHHILEV